MPLSIFPHQTIFKKGASNEIKNYNNSVCYDDSFHLLIFSSAFAQQGDQAEMMKKWQEYMTPGPAQQSLAKMAGAWKAEVTIFDSSGKEMKSDGTADYEMILGGRYLKSNFKGTMMGMPMEGMGLDAYDNATKEYISV